jgi:hypothetical protein
VRSDIGIHVIGALSKSGLKKAFNGSGALLDSDPPCYTPFFLNYCRCFFT